MSVILDLGKLCVRLSEEDNVLTALQAIQPGEYRLGNRRLVVGELIPVGFKVAIQEIAVGQQVIKYNNTIGVAVVDILPGMIVHIHNLVGIGSLNRQVKICRDF